jgi:hypothetical protein
LTADADDELDGHRIARRVLSERRTGLLGRLGVGIDLRRVPVECIYSVATPDVLI